MPAFGGGGIAFGASGKLYVALFAKYQLSILDSDGAEELRFPARKRTPPARFRSTAPSG